VGGDAARFSLAFQRVIERPLGATLALLVVIWGGAAWLPFLTEAEYGLAVAPGFVVIPMTISATLLASAALRRWGRSHSDQRSGALGGAIRGAYAAELTAAFIVVAIGLANFVVALLVSSPRASFWMFLAIWYLFGTPLGWYGVPITTAIGALYGALVHRVIISPDASPDEAPLPRLTDASLAP
jgi:hypothetical protein